GTIGLLVSGCTIPLDENEQLEMAWVVGRNARQTFERDRRWGRHRFFAVQGYSMDTPGVSWTEYAVCFYRSAKLVEFDGPGDVVGSPEQQRIGGLVHTFAKDYNGWMREHLVATGRTRCPAESDPDAAWSDMIELVGPPPNGVGLSQGVWLAAPEFRIEVTPGELERVLEGACAVLKRRRMRGLIDVVIERGARSIEVDCGRR
ncbi:MAG: hypothetical protein KC616_17715, partial [Myxococcales bacterium]|nr:hypothetical protein [Myxococcales bacterium]